MKYYATDIKAPMNLYENRCSINFIIMIMMNLGQWIDLPIEPVFELTLGWGRSPCEIAKPLLLNKMCGFLEGYVLKIFN